MFSKKRVGAFSIVALTFIMIAACTATTGRPAQSNIATEVTQVMQPEAYKLGQGDNISIKVYDVESLSGEFVIDPEGKIDYPLIGEVIAGGKTVEQFKTQLAQQLSPNYVRDPRIGIEVLNYRPYYILGEVAKPGSFEFISGMTIMEAVATAEGFTYRADSRRVFIKHSGQQNETSYVLTGSTPIQPGDVIRIPERRF
ncbi:polysaccharide biosynthesis/export family protein [Hirschia litorea]|uniref:Polysaccharide biosynthesis/export family protein n=1 Tax=Hirschia litorea TaxID=1199156 RepID=A0ABW2IQ33_9PROT